MKYLDSELETLSCQLKLANTLQNKKVIALNFMIENLSDQRDEIKDNIKVEEAKVELLQNMIDQLYAKRDEVIKDEMEY